MLLAILFTVERNELVTKRTQQRNLDVKIKLRNPNDQMLFLDFKSLLDKVRALTKLVEFEASFEVLQVTKAYLVTKDVLHNGALKV